jgi:hypothetical protein
VTLAIQNLEELTGKHERTEIKELASLNILELEECPAENLNNPELIMGAMEKLVRDVPLTAIKSAQYKFTPMALQP